MGFAAVLALGADCARRRALVGWSEHALECYLPFTTMAWFCIVGRWSRVESAEPRLVDFCSSTFRASPDLTFAREESIRLDCDGSDSLMALGSHWLTHRLAVLSLAARLLFSPRHGDYSTTVCHNPLTGTTCLLRYRSALSGGFGSRAHDQQNDPRKEQCPPEDTHLPGAVPRSALSTWTSEPLRKRIPPRLDSPARGSPQPIQACAR